MGVHLSKASFHYSIKVVAMAERVAWESIAAGLVGSGMKIERSKHKTVLLEVVVDGWRDADLSRMVLRLLCNGKKHVKFALSPLLLIKPRFLITEPHS